MRLKIEKGSEKTMVFCQNSLAANKGRFICPPAVSHLLRLPFESSVIIYGTKTGDDLDVLLGEGKADRL